MAAPREKYTCKPFAEALGDLLRERPEGGPLSRISLRAFFSRVDGWQYENLRKMVMGERTLRPEAIEAMSAVLDVTPEYFLEYREWRIRQALRTHPELVELTYDLVMTEARALSERKARDPGGVSG